MLASSHRRYNRASPHRAARSTGEEASRHQRQEESMSASASAPAPAGWLRHLTRARVAAALACVILFIGYHAPTERYLTPERGAGYALGILGGGMMLLLLLYPARKRVRWLAFIGTVKRWFQAHMFLGV